MERRKITLMEIMIVIVLIGLIGGVLAYNMRGTLDEGKVQATRIGGARVYNILMMEVAQGADPQKIASDWEKTVANNPLSSRGDSLCKDGWGQKYTVIYSNDEDDFLVTSKKYSQKWKGEKDGIYLR